VSKAAATASHTAAQVDKASSIRARYEMAILTRPAGGGYPK